jgi:hypothetical protein
MLTGLEWDVKVDADVEVVVVLTALVTDVECLNHVVDAREVVLSAKGGQRVPLTPSI